MTYIEQAEQARALVADMDEDTARSVWYAMQIKFGWAGTFFGRGDAEVTDLDGFDDHDLEITDTEWTVLSNSKDWSDYMPMSMTEQLERPYIERRDNGSFRVQYVGIPGCWYTADGTPEEEDDQPTYPCPECGEMWETLCLNCGLEVPATPHEKEN